MLTTKLALRAPLLVHVLDPWPNTLMPGGSSTAVRLRCPAHPHLDVGCRKAYGPFSDAVYIPLEVGDGLRRRRVPRDNLGFVARWPDQKLARLATLDLRRKPWLSEDTIDLMNAAAKGRAQGLGSRRPAWAEVWEEQFIPILAGSGTTHCLLRSESEHQRLRVIDEEGTALIAAAREVARALEQPWALGCPGLAEFGKRARMYYNRQFSARRSVGRIGHLLAEAAPKGAQE